jgi:hypothetical protein
MRPIEPSMRAYPGREIGEPGPHAERMLDDFPRGLTAKTLSLRNFVFSRLPLLPSR